MPDKQTLQRKFTGSETPKDLAEDFSMTKSFVDEKHLDEMMPWRRLELRVETLEHYDGESLPPTLRLPPLVQATPGSVGIDLFSANFDLILLNSIGATVVVPTGIKIELPMGYEAQVRPRSGLAAKEGITVLNSPGTVDSDYRGEIKVILTKLTTGKFKVERGMRIAQMVIAPVTLPIIEYVDRVNDTERGEAGFGSSGVKL